MQDLRRKQASDDAVASGEGENKQPDSYASEATKLHDFPRYHRLLPPFTLSGGLTSV
jgi:hypothetical protein